MLKHWRNAVLIALLALPVAAFLVAGTVALWHAGWWWLWWLLPLGWGTAYLLARRWREAIVPLPQPGTPAPGHWTPRDEAAAAIVQQQQQAVKTIAPQRFTEPQLYYETALQLALNIACHYHPQAKDPLSPLTVPEILAATHLACEDLEQWVRAYVPASHMLSVGHWRTLAKAPGWLRTLGDVSWAVAVVLYPANLARYAASRLTTQSASKQVQENVLAWFYISFVRSLGFYLIEMNSGRLRGGTERYRALMRQMDREAAPDTASPPDAAHDASPPDAPAEASQVTIAVVGQVKAGKSSLINALLGAQVAATDILPLTKRVARHRLEVAGVGQQLVLLDTPGYATDAPESAQESDHRRAYQQADLVLLVMNAAHPARDADLQLLDELERWCAQDLRRRPPPVLGVLTHIDLLRPVLQWSPPYDWLQPRSEKEQNIRAATDYHAELLGGRLAGIVPVCSDVERHRAFGVPQSLLPAMTALLDQAHACNLLRALHQELDSGRVRRLFQQLGKAGAELLRSCVPAAGPTHAPPGPP